MQDSKKKEQIPEVSDLANTEANAGETFRLPDREKSVENIPLWKKLNLTVEEASRYSGIGMSSLRDVMKNPACPFVLKVGKKKLIKRKEFEEWCQKINSIRN